MSSPGTRTGVSPERLREVASRLLTGVTIVTSASRAGLAGCTANAVTSLSLEPPLMLVCLRHESETLGTIRDSKAFAINLLGGDEESHRLCRQFASRRDDRFAGIAHRPGALGAPLLDRALGWFECRLDQAFACGDHTVCTGFVVDAEVTDESHRPLGFFAGQLFEVTA